jgi:hypothetical protein
MLASYPVKVEAVVSQNDGSLSVFFDILELDEDEDFSRMSTDPVLAYDDYRRKEKRLELIFKTSRPDLNIGDPVTLNFEQPESGAK